MYFADSERAEAIKQAYLDILQREADTGGLEFYYNSNQPIQHVRNILESSEEHRRLLNKLKGSGCEYEFIEPWVAVGSTILVNDVDTIKKEGFCALLDMCSTDPIYDPSYFELYFRLKLPGNVIISVSDVKKTLLFIKEVSDKFSGTNKKLLIVNDDGITKAPAIMALWYIGNGMDLDVAGIFVSSRRTNANLDAALLGPWHLKAAKEVLRK